jgi:hypothetical protein
MRAVGVLARDATEWSRYLKTPALDVRRILRLRRTHNQPVAERKVVSLQNA